jgi:hypothetical protein
MKYAPGVHIEQCAPQEQLTQTVFSDSVSEYPWRAALPREVLYLASNTVPARQERTEQ